MTVFLNLTLLTSSYPNKMMLDSFFKDTKSKFRSQNIRWQTRNTKSS